MIIDLHTDKDHEQTIITQLTNVCKERHSIRQMGKAIALYLPEWKLAIPEVTYHLKACVGVVENVLITNGYTFLSEDLDDYHFVFTKTSDLYKELTARNFETCLYHEHYASFYLAELLLSRNLYYCHCGFSPWWKCLSDPKNNTDVPWTREQERDWFEICGNDQLMCPTCGSELWI